jgi:hypothetical protein
VREALDADLDAYLDRELFTQPAEVAPAPVAAKPAERLQGVLALAVEEEQWLRTLPAPVPAENSQDLESSECPIPEHLKPKPAPEPVVPSLAELPPPEYAFAPSPAPLPGLAIAPDMTQPGWIPPTVAVPVPVPVPVAPRLGRWIAAGVLAGVSAASVLAVGVLWIARDSLPSAAEVSAAYAPAGAVTASAPAPAQPAHQPVLSVESSPLVRQPEPLLVDWSVKAGGGSEGAVPGPVVPGRKVAEGVAPAPAPVVAPAPAPGLAAVGGKQPSLERSMGPAIASMKAPLSLPREPVQARSAPVAEKPQPRRVVEDPYLQETEPEAPMMYPAPPAPAPVAVAKVEPAPPAAPKQTPYSDFDEKFAKELGFTDDSGPRKAPESKGPKAVWIPPDPANDLPERLTPADIQQVVVNNQPAIVSCIRRNQESLSGVSGGKFVLRWFVEPSGSTQHVLMETQALRGTPLATCLEGLVRGWKFPKHRVQQREPIRFPFTF